MSRAQHGPCETFGWTNVLQLSEYSGAKSSRVWTNHWTPFKSSYQLQFPPNCYQSQSMQPQNSLHYRQSRTKFETVHLQLPALCSKDSLKIKKRLYVSLNIIMMMMMMLIGIMFSSLSVMWLQKFSCSFPFCVSGWVPYWTNSYIIYINPHIDIRTIRTNVFSQKDGKT